MHAKNNGGDPGHREPTEVLEPTASVGGSDTEADVLVGTMTSE